jgi:hypothetical protein
MKKLSLYITLALSALFMGSCSGDDYENWADPQSNPQEDAITLPGYKAEAVNPVNLADVEGDSVAIFSLNQATLPEGYSLTNARVELTPQGVDAATTSTVSTSVDGKAAKSALQALIESAYGKAPVARTLAGHVYTNAIKNGEACLIDAGTVNVVVTPVAPNIEAAYYVLGGTADWTKAGALTQKFNHSANNVYDDPVFTITIKAKEGDDTWFAIAGEKVLDEVEAGNWDNVLGTSKGNGNNGLNVTEKMDTRANLKAADKTLGDCSFKVPASAGAKYIRIEINMLDYTYKITPLSFDTFIYETGNNTSWGDGLALYGPGGDGKYYGAFNLTSGFKFRSNLTDWGGSLNLGLGATVEDATSGNLVNSGSSSDIKPIKDGFYNVYVDAANFTYKLTPFTSIDIIGDGQPGGWDKGTVMTYDSKTRTWSAVVELTAGKSIKFRSDQKWDNVNLGGALNALVQDSNDNILVTKSGKFKVVLHLENQAAKAPYAELIAQ